MGEVIVGHGVHFVMCSAYLGLFLCGKVWFGVWYSLVWHGYRGVIAGQAEKGEQRFMGAVEDAWGCRPLECQSCHKTETVHRLSIPEEDHIGE